MVRFQNIDYIKKLLIGATATKNYICVTSFFFHLYIAILYLFFYSIISYGGMIFSNYIFRLDILVCRFSWAQKRQDAAFLPGITQLRF